MYSVSLSVSDLTKSLKYWNQLLGMKIYTESKTSAILGYGDDQVLYYTWKKYAVDKWTYFMMTGSFGVDTDNRAHRSSRVIWKNSILLPQRSG